ncbi:MAG: HAD family hydrolase [Betaproteobacteria bacterium]|jgi:HAD superfamily hydrolase (TIGR01490 family)|nr:HAD-IB family hydrolase [Rubrivivax sp.]
MTAPALALFDLDGTLLPRDSDHAFGEFLVQRGWASDGEFRRANDRFYADYLEGRLDMAAYVDFATAAWRDRPAAEQHRVLADFVDEVVKPMLHPAALELVQRHRDDGERLALVTATNEFVTRPIAALFGIDVLIATELERDAAGRVTGRIAGTPSFREGKIARVQAWLAGLDSSLAAAPRCTFYSDSTNDLPLLEAVSHPVATNPGAGLARIAAERGWPVIHLFT